MMDDFIRPPKKEVKQETKQRPIKEVLIVILIIVCLAIGYFAGYVSKKNVIVKNTNDSSIINEVYDTLDKYWVNTNDQDVNLNTSAIEGMVAAGGADAAKIVINKILSASTVKRDIPVNLKIRIIINGKTTNLNKEIKYVLFSTKILLKSISPISIPITIIANGPIILPTLEKVSTSKDGNCN